MDDLVTLFDSAAGRPGRPVDPAAIRGRVARRNRRRLTAISLVLLLVVVVPAVVLTSEDADVLLQEPTARPEPTPPSPVYGFDLDVDATVDPAVAADVTATGLPRAQASSHGLTLTADAAVIITADRRVTIALDHVTGAAGAQATAIRLVGADVVADRTSLDIPADTPTLIQILIPDMTDGTSDNAYGGTSQERVTIPVAIDDGSRGSVTVTITPVPRTAADLGIPQPADIPDETLPRPQSGEALPEQLADGTPVWVVGLDADVVVLGARSPHTPSGLVGWCPSAPAFIDSPGQSRFDSRGEYRFGPAPTGLVSYAIDIHTDTVTVLRRLAPPPRPAAISEEPGMAFPPIAALGPGGQMCQPDPGSPREDHRGTNPGWAQHDLDNWPSFDGQADGWYRSDTAEVDGLDGIRFTGDLLIQRQDGRTVDVAVPPGIPYTGEPTGPRTSTSQLVAVHEGTTEMCPDCTHGSVELRGVVALTPTGPVDLANTPIGDVPLSLVPTLAAPASGGTSVPLAEGVTVDTLPPALITITTDLDGLITQISPAD